MTDEEQISALKSEHKQLENKIEVEESRPAPDESILHHLKREKLRIKDKLATLHAL